MANQSVLELAVGTGKWDAGLKKAKQSLDNFTQANGGLQQALGKDSESMQKFVRMMGQMDSTAKTAKGQMNDYKSTIEQLTMQYNRMTEAQKKTIGQDYLQAIDQMKQKYQAVSREVQQMNQSLNNISIPEAGAGGGLFSGDKLSGMLQVFGGNLMTKAAGWATSFAADMGDMVKQGIELAKQGEGIRIAFERLGRGDILDGLREATHGTVTDIELMKAAVKFNDFKLPIEELGTMLAFAQQKAKDTGQSVDYMVDSIVTGLGRKSLMILDNLGLSANEVKEKMKDTGDMTKAVGEIIREQMSKAGDYVETAADRAAQADVKLKNAMEELGRTFQPLTDTGTSMWNSLKIGALDLLNTAIKPLIQAFTQLGAVQKIQDNVNGGGFLGRITDNLKNAKNKDYVYQTQLANINRAVNSARGNLQQAEKGGMGGIEIYRNRLKALENIRDEYIKVASQIMSPVTPSTTVSGSGKTKKGKKTTISDTDKQSSYWAKANANANIFAESFKPEDVLGPSEAWEEYKSVITGCSDSIADFSSETSKWTKNFDPVADYLEKDAKLAKQQQMAFDAAAQSAINLGAALANIDDPGAKAAGTVIGAIANIALGFGQAVAQASSMGPWAWLAYVAAGTAALATTISTVHSLTGYAEGGIVKGNHYSGDNVPALVDGSQMVGLNAGEVVLTAAQTNNLAAGIQNGGSRIQVVGKLSGEQLFICAERWAKRTGKGEFVTWR